MLAAILADASAEQIKASGRGTRWRPKPVNPAAQLPPLPTTAATTREVLLRKALNELDLVYETATTPMPDLRRGRHR
jgi:hypothetical protein